MSCYYIVYTRTIYRRIQQAGECSYFSNGSFYELAIYVCEDQTQKSCDLWVFSAFIGQKFSVHTLMYRLFTSEGMRNTRVIPDVGF